MDRGIHARPPRGSRLAALLLAAAASLVPARAAARPDHRPRDRFFYAVSAGSAVEGAPRAAGAYETSFWPNDWLGLGTYGSASASGSGTYDLGGELVLAVPLRWVQPYGGAAAGWRSTPQGVTRRVSLVAGVNAYVSRNVRLFVELRDLPQVSLIGDTHDELVLAGVRHSPDWFHRARGVAKVDAVWWSVLLTAGAWTAATLAR